MKWYTHAAVGANIAWIAALSSHTITPTTLPLLAGIGAFAALLPDLDATNAKIHHVGNGALQAFQGGVGIGPFAHRRLLHSIPIAIIILLTGALTIGRLYPLIPIAFTGGYFSHAIIDGFNMPGVAYWSPFTNKRYFLLPKFLRSPVGGAADWLLFFLAALGVIFLLALAGQAMIKH